MLPEESVYAFDRMLSEDIDAEERAGLAQVFKLLGSDHSIDLLLPLRSVDTARVVKTKFSLSECAELKKLASEVAELMVSSA